MLKASIHFSKPNAANAHNCLGKLEVGYARLDALADYKVAMVASGIGELPPAKLENYPRWSTSMWDLVARAACLCLSRKEAVWPELIPTLRQCAFVDELCVVVEHLPDGMDSRRATIGIAHIVGQKRKGDYRATFEDDMTGTFESGVFRHTPERMMPWDLLTRAYAWAKTGTFVLPARPTLYVPIPIQHEGVSYVAMDTVSAPARAGFERYVTRKNHSLKTLDWVEGPLVAEARFVEFLQRGI